MPGPEALRRGQYYGFPGNHFWRLISDVLGLKAPESYAEKKAMLREAKIALWDTLDSCARAGALDSSIRRIRLNDIPAFLRKHPRIRAIFVNGRSAQAYLAMHDPKSIAAPVFYLPSSSPAHAALSFRQKLRSWRAIRRWLRPRN